MIVKTVLYICFQVDLFLQWQVGSIACITPCQSSDVICNVTELIGRKTQDFKGTITSLEVLEEFVINGCISGCKTSKMHVSKNNCIVNHLSLCNYLFSVDLLPPVVCLNVQDISITWEFEGHIENTFPRPQQHANNITKPSRTTKPGNLRSPMRCSNRKRKTRAGLTVPGFGQIQCE